MSWPTSRQGKLETANVSFKWEIPNFWIFYNCYRIGECIHSPSFSTNQEKWFIELYPKGVNEKFKDFISFHLFSNGTRINQTKYTISILDVENKKCNTVEVLADSSHVKDFYKDYMKRSKIAKNKNRILPDDTLRILCEISLNKTEENGSTFSDTDTCPTDSNRSSPLLFLTDESDKETNGNRGIKRSWLEANVELSETNIKQSFKMLFNNPKFSDLRILCTSDRSIYAHKAILATQNEVFRTMLMSDIHQSVIEIHDIEYEVLREVIRYIYTAEVDDISKFALKLLAPAQQYLLKDLSLLCEKSLCDIVLVITNALAYYITADRFGLSYLKKKTADYIVTNMKDIVKAPGFEMITNLYPNVILDICKYSATQGE